MEALSERTKVRVDGLHSEATEDGLRDHFCKYGEVVRALVERDEASGELKGYGFVWFADAGCARAAVMDAEEQIMLGTKVEVCETTPRERSPVRHGIRGETSHRHANVQSGRNGYRNGKKIFVGGLPYGLTIEEFRGYFEEFGEITDAVIIADPVTRKPRGFGFVTFNLEESARVVLQNTWHRICDKDVEVKPAIPKEEATIAEQGNSRDGYYEPAIIYYGTNLPWYGDIGHTYGYFNAFTHLWPSPCGNGMSGYWDAPYMNNNPVTGFQGYNGLTARVQQTGIRITRPRKLNGANDAYSSHADSETSSSVIGNGNRQVSPSHLGSNNGHDRESTSTSGQPRGS